MSRKLRLEYAGACYHVMNRGNYRQDLFASDGAAGAFERCLGECAVRFCWRVHAYVIMRNHFHLALETPEPNLSEGMKWLQGTWAVRFNRFRREMGRPFQGRYKAILVEPGQVLARVAQYIHLNPVRAGVVPVRRLLHYSWSSLPRLAGPNRPAWLEPSTILRETEGAADSPAGWRRYLDHLGEFARSNPDHRESTRREWETGWAIGSDAFKSRLQERLTQPLPVDDRFLLLGSDRNALRQAREHLWEERLRLLANERRVDLAQLPRRKSDPLKIGLAAAMKDTTSVSNQWLAARLAMGTAASLSSLLSRFQRSSGRGVNSRFAT